MSDSDGDAAAAPSKYVVGTISPVAKPLASTKLHSKIYKAVKKGAFRGCAGLAAFTAVWG